MRTALALNFDAWVGAIEQCLTAAAKRASAKFDTRGLAEFVLTTMEGAVRSGYKAAEALSSRAEKPKAFLLQDLPATGFMRLV